MNKNQDQFKNPSNKKIMIRDWSSLMERAVDLLNHDLSSISLDALFQDLAVIRGGIERIDDVLQNDVTADEQKLNRLYEDHDLLKQCEQKLLVHLHQREIERNSHKEALQTKNYSFLDKEDWLENEDDSPEKAQTPSRQPESGENVQVKCELRFEENMGMDVHKELIRRDDQYFRKVRDGEEIRLNSQVEIQDEEEENGNIVRKKIITLSMPREERPATEVIRRSHSEKIPVNIDLEHELHRRPESERDQYSDRDYEMQSGHMSKKDSQQANPIDSQEGSREADQPGSVGPPTHDEPEDPGRFRKQPTVSGFEEVSGDAGEVDNWNKPSSKGTGRQNSGKQIQGSNIQFSDFNVDKEIKIPFQDSQPPETIEHAESPGEFKQRPEPEAEPEPARPMIENKRSIKEIIMNHNKFEDEHQGQYQQNFNDVDVYANSIENTQMSGKNDHAENSQDIHSLKHSNDPNQMIYSRDHTMETQEQPGEPGMEDTSKRFYPNQREESKREEGGQQVDQANATPKQKFYPREQTQNNRNTLNQLIRNQTGQSHRSRMNDLKTHQISDHIPNNLESLQTVNSNWITGREDSAFESGNFGQTRGRSGTNEDGQQDIKSFGEIIQDSISGRDHENNYYGYKPGRVERVSHPDDKSKQPRAQERPKPQPKVVREVPREEQRQRQRVPVRVQEPVEPIIKEKRLSHRSKMIVLPVTKFGSRSNSRGMSLEEYNKRASSLTVKTTRFSRKGMI